MASQDLSQHTACQECHARKIRCIAGAGACESCTCLGIRCKQRTRKSMGRPRGIRQSSWRLPPPQINDQRQVEDVPPSFPQSLSSSSSSSPSSPSCSTLPAPQQQEVEGAYFEMAIWEPSTTSSLQQQPNDQTTLVQLTNSTEVLEQQLGTAVPEVWPTDWNDLWGIEFPVDIVSEICPPPERNDDLDLCDIHARIRSANHAYRDPNWSNVDPTLKEQENLGLLEELSGILHKLSRSRPIFMLGMAAVWDAVELAKLLALSLNDSTGTTYNNFGAGAPAIHKSLHEDQLTRSQASSSSTAILMVRSRRRASMMGLIRMQMCLLDFANSVSTFTAVEEWMTPRVLQLMSNCRAQISRIHGEVKQNVDFMTWTSNAA